MNRVIQVAKRNGSWVYRIAEDHRILVEWQFGPSEKADVLAQAKSRFGSLPVVEIEEV